MGSPKVSCGSSKNMSPRTKAKTVAAFRRSAKAVTIPRSSEPFNDVRTSYFAGLIDGEGYVTLMKNTGRVTSIWNVPTIVISMTHKETILACASYFRCGCVHLKDSHLKKNPHHKLQYCWTIRWDDARRVAAMIRPFSITKRQEVQRIIDLPIQRSGPERKLTDRQVRNMRSAYPVLRSYAKLGARYGVGTMTAWRIVNRKLYADVN